MKIIKRLPGDIITVLHDSRMFQGRVPTSLFFSNDYASALRAAFKAIKSGRSNVRVVQFRDSIHTHSELETAMSLLSADPSDEEVIEQAQHASSSHQDGQRGLAHLFGSTVHRPLGWALV